MIGYAEREMERALQQDGEKLRKITGEDHGPWELGEPTPGGDGCHCTHHPDDPAHGSRCYEPPQQVSADEQAFASVRAHLANDQHNCHIVATSVSLRQAASETPADFVRRIVGAWLGEAAR